MIKLGNGSTENKVNRLAEIVGSLPIASGGGSLGRVVLEHRASGSTWNDAQSNNLLFTCPDYQVNPVSDWGYIKKTPVIFPNGEGLITNNLYLPPISGEQNEILKELYLMRKGHLDYGEEYQQKLAALEVYVVNVHSRFSHYLQGNDSAGDYLKWTGGLFSVFKKFNAVTGEKSDELTEFNSGNFGSDNLGLKKISESVYLDNDGKEIIASFSGVMLGVPSLIEEKQVYLPFRSGGAPYGADNHSITSFEIVKTLKIADFMGGFVS